MLLAAALLLVAGGIGDGGSRRPAALRMPERIPPPGVRALAQSVPVARRTDDGLPVPQRTRELYPRRREGRFGPAFQAVYESAYDRQALAAFYWTRLSDDGWRLESEPLATDDAAAGMSLSFRRENRHLLVTLFPNASGCDFRLGMISRPPRRSPLAQE